MSQKFQVTAELKLVAPRNLRQVANQIHRTLNGTGGTGSGGSGHANSTNFSANSPASRGFGQLRQQMLAAAQASQKTTKAVNTARHGFDSLGKSALVAAKRFTVFTSVAGSIYAVAHALKNGITEGIAWQDGMVKIAQITGKSTKQLRGLSDTMHGLATGLGTSSRDLLQVSNTLSQAGLSAKDTKTALDALAKSSLAPTFGKISDTAEATIAIMGQFGTSVDKLEGQLGSINAVSAKYAVESADLTTAIRVSGGAFKQAGGNLNELMALFTSVRSRTRESASTIANAFRTIFARLQRKGTQKSLHDLLGIDLSANGISDKPLEMIRKLHMAMKDLPEGSLLAAKVGEQVGGIRQLSKTIPLIKEYGTAVEALRVAQAGENSLSRDTITAQESLAVQLTRTRESWQAFYHNLVGDSGFQSAIKSMLALARGAATLADSLRPLIPALTAFASIRLGTMAIGSLAGRFGLGKHAAGGLISGGTPGQDSVPSLLMPGEFVMQRSAVQKLGVGNLQRMNRMKRGGLVGAAGSPDEYSIAPTQLSSSIQTLISVIKDEVSATRADIAERKAAKTGTYGFAQPKPASTPLSRRLMMRDAMALPLTSNSFEENALDVINGGSADFGKKPTYGVSPIFHPYKNPRERISRGRGYLREDREDFIRKYKSDKRENGYGGLLSHIRQTSLSAQSDAYLASLPTEVFAKRGRIGGRFIAGAGTRLASAGRFVKSNLRGTGLAIGALALSGQGEAIGEHFGGRTGKSAATGLISGAALGATIGSVGGIHGAVIGGVIGGVHGIISSLDQLKKDLADEAVADGLKGIGTAVTELGSALSEGKNVTEKTKALLFRHGQSHAIEHNAAIDKSEDSTFRKIGNKLASLLPSSSFLDFKGGAALQRNERLEHEQAYRHESSRQRLYDSATVESQVLDAIIKNNKSGNLRNNQTAMGLIRNRATLRAEEQFSNRKGQFSDSEFKFVVDQFLAEELKIVDGLKKDTEARQLNLTAIESFSRTANLSTSSVEGLTSKLTDLATASQRSDNRHALLTGIMGSSAAATHHTQLSANLTRMGSAGFESSAGYLAKLSPHLANASDTLINANRAHNALTKNLPRLLGSADLDIGTEHGMEHFRRNISQSLRHGGVSQAVREHVENGLQDLQDDPGFAKTYGSGTENNKLRDKLLSFAKEIQSAEIEAAKAIESHAERLHDSLGKLASLGNDIIASRHDEDNARLAGARFSAERRGGDITSHLSIAAQQTPFIANQQRLTGLSAGAAVNPQAILGLVNSARQAMLAAAKQVEANPADTHAIASMRGFESATQRGVQALKNLADASKLNASLQERLASLDRDKDSRLGLAERFAQGSPQERAQLNRGAALTMQAHAKGSLDAFGDQDKKSILDFLNAAGGTRLSGIAGGEKTGEDVKRELLANSFGGMFRPSRKDRDEARGLEGHIMENHGKAADAQTALTSVLESTTKDFLRDLGDNQQKFLDALGTTLKVKPVSLRSENVNRTPVPVRQLPNEPVQAMPQAAPQRVLPVPLAPQNRLGNTTDMRARRTNLREAAGIGRKLSRLGRIGRERDLTPDEAAEQSDLQSHINSLRTMRLAMPQRGMPRNARQARYQVGKQARAALYQSGKQGRKATYEKTMQDRRDTFQRERGTLKDRPARDEAKPEINQAAANFEKSVGLLATNLGAFEKAAGAIPHEISLKGTIEQNININGADLLAKLEPQIQVMIAEAAKSAASDKLKQHLPELGIA